MIHVVHRDTHFRTHLDLYIGRGSVLFKNEITEELDQYEAWLLDNIEKRHQPVLRELGIVKSLAEKSDVYLVCSSSSKPCYGDVVKKIVQDMLENSTNFTS